MINSHKPSERFYRHNGSRDNGGNDRKFLPRCIVKSKFQDRRDGKEKKRKEGGREEEEKKGDKKEENKGGRGKGGKGEDLTLALPSGVLVGHWRNQPVPMRETNVHREMLCVQSRGGVGRTCSLLFHSWKY